MAMAERAKDFVEHHFAWTAIAGRLEQMYLSVAAAACRVHDIDSRAIPIRYLAAIDRTTEKGLMLMVGYSLEPFNRPGLIAVSGRAGLLKPGSSFKPARSESMLCTSSIRGVPGILARAAARISSASRRLP